MVKKVVKTRGNGKRYSKIMRNGILRSEFMKWVPKDITMYKHAKEYVDSALLTAVPLSFNEEMEQSAVMNEFMTGLNFELEKQFKGRILIIPQLVYLEDEGNRVDLVKPVTTVLRKKGFKHVFLLTSDEEWSVEQELEAEVFLIPLLDPETEDGEVRVMAKERAQEIGESFKEIWNNEQKNRQNNTVIKI